jgi:fructokinase
VDLVVVTAGENGCRIYSGKGMAACPGYRVQVADTVGSGDAFTAAFLVKLGQGASPAEAGDCANRLGAVVASKRGAIPDYDPGELGALTSR